MNPHRYSPMPESLVRDPSPTVTPDDLQAKIAEHIECLKSEITALQKRHNSSTLIGRLPTELLSRIFSMLSSDWKRWIRVTHVCHHWREIALGCASLWSNITFSHQDFTKAKLRRSKGAPLTVKYDPEHGKPASYGQLALVLSNPDRLRHVSLGGAFVGIYQALFETWTRPCPTLKSFSLVMQCSTLEYLPAGFLQGPDGVPSLETLNLAFCGNKWKDLPLGRSLTTLHLQERHYCRNHPHRPSLEEFLQSMNNMPLLQNIHLHGFLPLQVHSPVATPSPSPLCFPDLRRIKVKDLAESVAQFFDVILIPDLTASIDIGFMGQPTPHFCGSYRQVDRNIIGLTLQRLKSSLGSNRHGSILIHKIHASVTTFRFQSLSDSNTSDSSHTIRVSSTLGTFTYGAYDLLTIFSGVFDFSALRVLEVDASHPALRSSDVWQYLGALPNIATVRLTGGLPPPFFDALKARAACPLSAPKAACFPLLESLSLCSMNIPTQEGDPEDVSIWEFTQRLIGVCRKRSKLSHPLSELHIRDFEGMGAGEAERIRKAVPGLKVVWHTLDYYTSP